MEVRPGLRVVRGPDWERGNEDGGEGYVGTVVAGGRADGTEDGRHDIATVQWDVGGERHVYRCGAGGKYDLRVIDSAQAGVVHRHLECSGCGGESIAGCVWRCVHCLRYYLCTPCYMKDSHSVWHHFMRIDSPENPRQRTRVRCRYLSGRVGARGLFVGARVVRGRDWRWSDQDGGAEREGTVVEVCGWQSESSRSVAVVEWRESGLKRKYRLGHKGKVDLQCTVAAEGGHCYLDHLPLLGSEYNAPTTPFICAGDRARLEMDIDLLKSCQETINNWDERLVDLLGMVGFVNLVDTDIAVANIVFSFEGSGFTVVLGALQKVEGPEISIDDVVRVIDDMAEVHRLQKDTRGWHDDMALSLGQLGRVHMFDQCGHPCIVVNGYRWVMHSSCVVPAPGEQPENEQSMIDMTKEQSLGVELLWVTTLEEPMPEALVAVTENGCATVLADMLKKWPDQANTRNDDDTLLHIAAGQGYLNCLRVLLEHNADITATDVKGDISLHHASRSDINKRNDLGWTPVHIAAALGYSRLLGLFLEHPKCDMNAQNFEGDSPLHLAVRKRWTATTRQLLDAGADISVANYEGCTVFIGAVTGGFDYGVEIFLEAHPGHVNSQRWAVGTVLSMLQLQFLTTLAFSVFLPQCSMSMCWGADNSIQDVPVYITVACFLKADTKSTKGAEKTTPTTESEATPPEVSVSGGDSNKMEESEVDSVTGPSCFLCEGPCDISFQPCGHTAMCAECVQSVSVKRCPICKVESAMEVKPGLRVVRGPDWERGNEDGGEGYVGTVVAGGRADDTEDGRHDVATVQWDVGGERHVYRCGAGGKYDLRVIDSAQAGVVHRHLECSGCGSESIAGCVWRCVHCLRYYLCTPCYMKDRHSVWHHFMRIDSPENPRQRTRVRCRYQSGRVGARGLFVGARVVRGRDWRWSDQDGGAGREGTVVEVCGWQSESSRSVAVVEWRESGLKRKYRLGHKGKVDLQCTVAAEGGHCYLDHLPLLGSEYKAPTTPFICAGDIAKLEMDLDLLKAKQDQINAWDATIPMFLGKTGIVNRVGLDEITVLLTSFLSAAKFRLVPDAVKKVEGPDILPDDVVRVIDDMAEVHRLQKDGRGWEDDMALSLGQLGRLTIILEDGSVVVMVNGRRWILDPLCLIPARGERPEDEDTEAEVNPGIEILLSSMMREPQPDVLVRLATKGHAQILDSLLKKWPDQVNVLHDGKTLLHIAAAEGRLNAVQVLLEHNADIATAGSSGAIPLHSAVQLNHYQVVKLLLDKGSDVNKRAARGTTPVHLAATLGFSRVLRLLIQHPDSDINAQNEARETPLHLSCLGHWPAATKVLLEAGADVMLLNLMAANPFLHAVVNGFYHGVELIMQYHPEIINQTKIDDGYTPLHVAAQVDNCDALCYLAAMETCELDTTTYIHHTALLTVCKEGFTRCVEALVGYGADPNIADERDGTSLHFILAKRNMKPLSRWTPQLNKFHEYVSGADNSIQDVPVFITVACFLVSEGASLETQSLDSGITPLDLCRPEYHSLLKMFARPERRGNYRGSLPRHPPPVPRHIQTQVTYRDHKAGNTSTGGAISSPANKATFTKTADHGAAGPQPDDSGSSELLHNTEASFLAKGVGDSNKTEESEVESVTGPSCFLCEGPCDISFQPCGHTAMCAECVQSVSVKRCPTCRNDVLQKIKISS
ncbi:E3 ubiquitin-protein ligase MIB2 [Geodia barretti]|uniref:RING-type E3 ubiquitin transferase n=1 Tax=Geodia barretti TaxID=519541 RepID=A0AA35X0P6_GEOBA|nr:E3 ubiquitin-protein ligase MIB2 [Geodia barretti]